MLPRPDESFEAFAKRTPATTPVPFAFFAELFAITKELRAQINTLDTSNKALQARVAGLEGVKRGPSISWAGPHEAGRTYRSGELTQKSGLWLALRETTSAPGADPGSWRLLVHAKLVPKHDE
jgi:hypothetical protein